MFNTIMVPVDLAHLNALAKPLTVAADLAGHYEARLRYVSVTTSQPSSVAHTPEEYAEKPKAFAHENTPDNGQEPSAHVYNSHDPVTDLDDILVEAVEEIGADLVITGTHLPKYLDAIMPANGSKIASHTQSSVFLVRPDAA